MPDITLEWRGLPRLLTTMGAAEKALPGELTKAMESSITLVRNEAARNLGGYGLQRMTGTLHGTVRPSMGGVTGTLTVAHPGFWVEHGRRPGKMPPLAAIRGWALDRGLVPFLVARAIGRRGIRARPFLVPAFEKHRPGIRSLFQRAGVAVLARIKGA